MLAIALEEGVTLAVFPTISWKPSLLLHLLSDSSTSHEAHAGSGIRDGATIHSIYSKTQVFSPPGSHVLR